MSAPARIGLLGGSFNPVHLGHLIMAENARDQLDLDQVVFVPAGSPPHKQGQHLASVEDRVAMVRLAIAGHDAFVVSDLDIDHREPSFTWRLLERFHDRHSAADLWFIMGGDSLHDFPTWSRPERIIELARLAVIERPGFRNGDGDLEAVSGLRDRVDLVETPLCSISSTDVRMRVEAQATIRYLVPDAVRAYIRSRGLYR